MGLGIMNVKIKIMQSLNDVNTILSLDNSTKITIGDNSYLYIGSIQTPLIVSSNSLLSIHITNGHNRQAIIQQRGLEILISNNEIIMFVRVGDRLLRMRGISAIEKELKRLQLEGFFEEFQKQSVNVTYYHNSWNYTIPKDELSIFLISELTDHLVSIMCRKATAGNLLFNLETINNNSNLSTNCDHINIKRIVQPVGSFLLYHFY